jgi:hypothetical protein
MIVEIPVLVVGAEPVGLSTSIMLSRFGRRAPEVGNECAARELPGWRRRRPPRSVRQLVRYLRSRRRRRSARPA